MECSGSNIAEICVDLSLDLRLINNCLKHLSELQSDEITNTSQYLGETGDDQQVRKIHHLSYLTLDMH